MTMGKGDFQMTIGTGYSLYNNSYGLSMHGTAADFQNSGIKGTDAENEKKIPVNPDEEKKAGRRSSPEECETCKNRKYQDGSDEANVSFKAAAHVSPEAAGSAVRAHEGQHVSNAYKKAAEGNGKVLSASVAIHTSVCPECGRSYVSGGTTSTMIKYTNESNPYQKELKATDAMKLRGANIDLVA